MIWETDPKKHPQHNHVSRIVNISCGTVIGFWNGYQWRGEAYRGPDDYLISDVLDIKSWLKTPEDIA